MKVVVNNTAKVASARRKRSDLVKELAARWIANENRKKLEKLEKEEALQKRTRQKS